VVSLLHAAHRAAASILVGVATEQVVQKPFAHRAIGHFHAIDAQLLEDLGENGHATGE
jgi:hypothetical protein